jgi:hypothetical protein
MPARTVDFRLDAKAGRISPEAMQDRFSKPSVDCALRGEMICKPGRGKLQERVNLNNRGPILSR